MILALKSEMTSTNPLELLNVHLKPALTKVDDVIGQSLQADVPLIEELAKHLIFAGGKRIRPLLTLASAAIFSQAGRAIDLAAAVEFIHTATLLHDDVVDDSDLRRGMTAAHKIWGNSASVLVGDFLFARAFQLMVKTNNFEILSILSHTSAQIAAGEVLQLTHAHSLDLSLNVALQIIGAKTAELFAAACQTGAISGGASSEEAHALYQYGYQLGIVFQIIDDILDYTASDPERGKQIGDDFREGKITLPIIFAFQSADDEEKKFLQHVLATNTQELAGFQNAVKLVNKYQGFDKAKQQADQAASQARQALGTLKVKSYVIDQLFRLVDFCMARQS